MFSLTAEDVHYVAMPLFHSNAVMAGWALALVTGATVALAERFSAAGSWPTYAGSGRRTRRTSASR